MRRELLTFGAWLAIGLGATGNAQAGLTFGDILVSDTDKAAIFDVNPTTGARTVFSESGVSGTGVALSSPQGIAFDPLGFVVVADSGLNALVKIDEATGNRTILSQMGVHGMGTGFNNPIGLTTDAAGNIYVADQGGFSGNGGQVFEVNPTTGNRTVISGNGVGLGTVFDNIGGIAFVNGKLVVTDSGDFATASSVLSVNPISGQRTLISSGGSLDNVRGIILGPAGSVDTVNAGGGFPSFAGPPSLVNLNVGTGMQATISGGAGAIGSGPSFANPYDLAVSPLGLIYVTDAGDSSHEYSHRAVPGRPDHRGENDPLRWLRRQRHGVRPARIRDRRGPGDGRHARPRAGSLRARRAGDSPSGGWRSPGAVDGPGTDP